MDDTAPINTEVENTTGATGSNGLGAPLDSSSRPLAFLPPHQRNFKEQAFKYVSGWCKASRDFVKRKVERWKLLEDLYHNHAAGLNSWSTRSDLIASEGLSGVRKTFWFRERQFVGRRI